MSGQPAEAANQQRKLLEDFLRNLGPDHPLTLQIRASLAASLGQAGQTAEAATQFRELLDDRRRVLGPDHPDTVATREALASWLEKSQ